MRKFVALIALFAAFGTLGAIKRAGAEELSAVKGISPKDAENIAEHFAHDS